MYEKLICILNIMSTQEYIRSITDAVPDDFPTLTPLPEVSASAPSESFFSNVGWQTWVIIFLILTLLGINIFSYLAKGTEETVNVANTVFGPAMKFFGYNTLETTKQTVQNSATGTKAGVDIVNDTATGTIDSIQQYAKMQNAVHTQPPPNQASQIKGQIASSSLKPVQEQIQQTGANIDEWQQDSLKKALEDASSHRRGGEPSPDDSRSSIQTTGKAGWCFIGEEHGTRTCSEIGVNDACMSGDVFPNQAICMNPNLRA
jgi:hypothetical protein